MKKNEKKEYGRKNIEMHDSSYKNMIIFRDKYLDKNKLLNIADLGSMDLNGSYKPIFENINWKYTGLDVGSGKNVDIVLKDIYNWPIEDKTFDIVVSGQVFEHIEFIWLTIKEINRILKPGGICCIMAPSSGKVHRYPVDCWRFHIDGFNALAKWAKMEVVEIYYDQFPSKWNNVIFIGKRI